MDCLRLLARISAYISFRAAVRKSSLRLHRNYTFVKEQQIFASTSSELETTSDLTVFTVNMSLSTMLSLFRSQVIVGTGKPYPMQVKITLWPGQPI